jgi:hypothetical protein
LVDKGHVWHVTFCLVVESRYVNDLTALSGIVVTLPEKYEHQEGQNAQSTHVKLVVP